MAMPYRLDVWSKKFVQLLTGLANGLPLEDLSGIAGLKKSIATKPKTSAQKTPESTAKQKKSRLITHSKSRYIVESQSSKWLIYKEGESEKMCIVWFGEFRKKKGALAGIIDALGQENLYVKVLQEDLGQALSRKTCVGQYVFHVRKDAFDAVIKWKPFVGEISHWNKIKDYIKYTSQIDKVEEISASEKSPTAPAVEKSDDKSLKIIPVKNNLKYYWVIGHSVHGAMHRKYGIPNEDAILSLAGEGGYGPPIILAVADGVSKSPRSNIGAQIAVESAVAVLQKLIGQTNTSLLKDYTQ